jgi:TRAP-type C4-dicarboxylate transport system substrate-binding protein
MQLWTLEHPDANRFRRSRRNALRSLVALAALSPCLRALAQAKPRELRLSTAGGPSLPIGKAATRWAELISSPTEASTPAARVFPGAALAQRDPEREFLALAQGAADLAAGSALAWSTQVPALAVYSLPWLARDAAALDAVVRDPAITATVAERVAAAGAMLLAIAPLGWRDIATAKGPLRTPADFAGLALRVTSQRLTIDLYAALGVRVSSVGFAEAQLAFTSGALDAQEGPATALASARVAGLGLRTIVRLYGTADALVFAARKAAWDMWTDAERARVQGAAEQAAREIDAPALEEAALVELRRQGASVVRLGVAEIDVFRGATRSITEQWSVAVGASLAEAAAHVARNHAT